MDKELEMLVETPLTSRFVAPWDTSGWYYVNRNFGKDCRVYSNRDVRVAELSPELQGGDYVVTYDSIADGVDDKQGMVFFVETACLVHIALDAAADPSFIVKEGFSRTSLSVRTSDNVRYNVYSASFEASSELSLEGFSGSCHHYFAIVCPVEGTDLVSRLPVKACDFRVHEVQTEELRPSSGWHVCERSACSLEGAFCFERRLPDSCNYEVRFNLSDCTQGVSVQVSDFILPVTDGSYRFVAASGLMTVWKNCREVLKVESKAVPGSVFALHGKDSSHAVLRLLSIRDCGSNTVVDEDMSMALDNETVSVPVRAKADRLDVEVIVRNKDDGFNVLCDVCGPDGRSCVRIAMYRRNLYFFDGSVWRRLVEGCIGGMYYPERNWYVIRLCLNYASQEYDFYLDGALRLSGQSFACEASELGSIAFSGNLETGHLTVRVPDYPIVSEAVLDVRKAPYNAIGDGASDDTAAIQKAVDDAGGTGAAVLLKGGVFLTGEIELGSEMTFIVAEDAVLRGSQDHGRYPLRTPSDSLCAHRQLGRGLLYGDGIENVTITGGGTIDGNGNYRFKMNDPVDRQADARPCFIYLANSTDIEISSLNFFNAAFWGIVPLSCRNVLIENINIDCRNTPNRDGIDPVDTSDMTIRNCCIIAGDDGICMKSSSPEGCNRVDICNVMVQSLASGIKFGTDSYGSFSDFNIHDCMLKNINRCGVSIETVDGALIENIHCRRMDMSHVGSPLYMVIGNRGRTPVGTYPRKAGCMRNVSFEAVRSRDPYRYSHSNGIHEVFIVGEDEDNPICDVTISGSSMEFPGGSASLYGKPGTIGTVYPEFNKHGDSAGSAMSIRYAKDVQIRDTEFIILNDDVRPAVSVCDSDGVVIQEGPVCDAAEH